VSLALLVGPANAGKVASLLDRYVAALDREPFLVVPNRGEVERIERELLTRVPVLLAGAVGTFDDLFERVVQACPGPPLLTRTQRSLLVTSIVSREEMADLAASARFGGFVDALADSIAELEAALVEPVEAGGELGRLYGSYRQELDRLGVWDAELRARRAGELVAGELESWGGSPVFVYGFEDLSGAQWGLLEALAGRTDVCVSLPYEPGRPAFEALARTAGDLAALAGKVSPVHVPHDGRTTVEELTPKGWYDEPALAYLERVLFEDREAEPPPLGGAVRFLEASGARAALELVAEELLTLLRAGTAAEDIGVVVPAIERVRAPLETAFGALGVPYVLDGPARLSRTPLGRALLALLRFAWLATSRRDLFSFLRSPYSGLPRYRVDFVEGRLRGRGVSAPARVEEESARLLGHRLPVLDELRAAPTPLEGVRTVVRGMLRAGWGLERPIVDELLELDLRAEESVRRALEELERWGDLGGRVGHEEMLAALERATVSTRVRTVGRVQVLDLLQARTRRFGVVFLLGLEEGVLPRRAAESAFLSDDRRRELEEGGPGRRLVRSDQVARDRYLFYTACTRAWQRLYLVREAATEDGRPLEPSPFWEEVRSRFAPADVERWTRRRPLSALAWELHRAPTERERLRAVAVIASQSEDEARALASAGGWSRQLERAVGAFSRPTRLSNAQVLQQLESQTRFSVTELEQFGDCSSIWLIERVVEPKRIDAEIDPRLRGAVAHQALYRFYSGLPKRFGADTVDLDRLDEAIEFLRECLQEAIASQVRLELPELDLLELEGRLARDLEHFVRQDAVLDLQLVPRRFEVAFGSERAAPELQRGLDLGGFTVSGKIDRIDVDPFSARGIVQDYKSGSVAHSAARIESERRLQIPLYVLALRDLVGIEPLGGLYRALAGEREARGLLRLDAGADLVPGLADRDYLDEQAFWSSVDLAVERAREAVARIRTGDVRHDPRGGECPSWCGLWPMCRVAKA
jgi:ATP-dependent helicase/DNAse subunit B